MEMSIFWPMFLMFVVVPVLTAVFFGVSLYRYTSGRRRLRQDPDCIRSTNMEVRLGMLILSSAMLSIVVLAVIGLLILESLPIRFM